MHHRPIADRGRRSRLSKRSRVRSFMNVFRSRVGVLAPGAGAAMIVDTRDGVKRRRAVAVARSAV
jgi:hypothetical protein